MTDPESSAGGEQPQSKAESREDTRLGLRVRVDLRSSNTFFTGFSENISEGGLFIATEAPFHIGEELDVEVSLMGDGVPLKQRVVVRWVRPPEAAGGLPAGMGVQFLGLGAGERTMLQEFVDSRVKETLFYDLD